MNCNNKPYFKQTALGYKSEIKDDQLVNCLDMTFQNDEERRKYFMTILKEKLKDPEFHKTEGFPIGSDEDILALSDPPYYTACPNPFITDFIKNYGKLYDPNKPYNCEPFAADVSEGKQDPICMAHTYHTKVPYRAIVRYIMNYTEPGDLVLDSFAGTGMTGVAAQACAFPPDDLKHSIEDQWNEVGRDRPSWGIRHAIMIDLSPFATFLSSNFNSYLNASAFRVGVNKLVLDTETHCSWLYETDHPQDDRKGIFEYGLWSDVVYCECGNEVRLWDPFSPSESKEFEFERLCPKCGRKITKNSSDKAHTTIWDDLINRSTTQNRQDLVLIQARFGNLLISKQPSDFDLQLILKISKTSMSPYTPKNSMMFNGDKWGDMYRAGYHYGISHTHHFWTRRNLIALTELFETARRMPNYLEMMFLCTSFAVKTGSRMHNVGFKGGLINLAGQIYNTLQFPSVSAERNVFSLARRKMEDLEAVFEMRKERNAVFTSTQSATSLKCIPEESIDYIFIDPPFGENIIYSELSFLYESWLRVFTKQDYEAIISKKQQKGLNEYKGLMTKSFQELFRVLKPGRWITVAFHNSKNAVWNAIQESIGFAGFIVADVRVLDKGQGTYKQMTTAGAVKQDLVISAYKPNRGLERRFKLEAGTIDGVWDFIQTHLKQLPIFVSKNDQAEIITERQNYLLYDRMVAFHVQRGIKVPISAGEFYSELNKRCSKRDDMYFLSEQVAEYDRKRMTVKYMEQLSLFVYDENSTIQWLRKELSQQPQNYQEIQPKFLLELHKVEHEKLPELQEILDENFLKNDDGKWYVADPQKLTDLEKIREKSLLREFQIYRDTKGKLKTPFRSEAVRVGFSRCWADADYESIIKVAEKLPDDVLQEDPTLLMYYDNALTRRSN